MMNIAVQAWEEQCSLQLQRLTWPNRLMCRNQQSPRLWHWHWVLWAMLWMGWEGWVWGVRFMVIHVTIWVRKALSRLFLLIFLDTPIVDAVLTRMIRGLRGYKLWGEVRKMMFIFIRIEEIRRGCDQPLYKNPLGTKSKEYWRKNDAAKIFKSETLKKAG